MAGPLIGSSLAFSLPSSVHGEVAMPTFPAKRTNSGPSVITSIAVVSAASFAIA